MSEKKKKKKEQRSTGRSVAGTSNSNSFNYSDNSSQIDPSNVMRVPELDDSSDLPEFGSQGPSKILQKGDSEEYSGGKVKKGKLSVIPSELESSTEQGSKNFDDVGDLPDIGQVEQQATLRQSKEVSNSRGRKKRDKKEIQAKDKSQK